MIEGILSACVLLLAVTAGLFVGAISGRRYYMPPVFHRLLFCARLSMFITDALLVVALVLIFTHSNL